jgi:SOS-response transcriptional repressor LexA
MAEMIRVGTRIRKDLNDWLDQQSEETGLPKSTQIMMAIENYQQQKMAKGQITELGELISKLEELSKQIEE